MGRLRKRRMSAEGGVDVGLVLIVGMAVRRYAFELRMMRLGKMEKKGKRR